MPSELDDILAEDWNTKGPAQPQPKSELEEITTSPDWPPLEPEVTGETPWTTVLGRGARNFGPDVIQTGQDIAGGLYTLATDPKSVYHGVRNMDWGKLGAQLKHDYLTEEGWKQGIANRPFSRMLDVGTVAAGPGWAAGRAGLTGVARASRWVDPAHWAVEGAKKGAYYGNKISNSFVGATGTHTGESLNAIFDAAFKNRELAKATGKGLSGKFDLGQAIGEFENAVRAAAKATADRYRTNKAVWGADRQQLDWRPVMDAIDEVDQRFGQGSWLNPSTPSQVSRDTQAVRDATTKAVDNHWFGWTQTGDPQMVSPIGFDDLKHKLDAVVRETEPGSQAHAAATIVRDAVANEIKAKAPAYTAAMEDYQKSIADIEAYRRELSLGKGNPDQAARKLFSSLRHNVLANFQRREQLAKKLTEAHPGAERAFATLAGQYNSSPWPRGVVGQFKAGAAPFVGLWGGAQALAGASVNPFLAAGAIGMQSPRLMGTMNKWAGQAGRNMSRLPYRPVLHSGNVMRHMSPYMPEEEE